MRYIPVLTYMCKKLILILNLLQNFWGNQDAKIYLYENKKEILEKNFIKLRMNVIINDKIIGTKNL